MSEEWSCPFCGSKELKVKSGNVELVAIGKDGPVYKDIENFCCMAQKQNAKYVKKNFHPDNRPDPDEVAKW